MPRSRKIIAAADAIGAALSTERFRRRFAAAGTDTDSLAVVEAMARDELERTSVDLTGLRAIFSWDGSQRKLSITLEPDRR